ncbi:unnamed protein product [Pylaiella littoralis]
MARGLMGRCDVGSLNTGGRRQVPAKRTEDGRVWGSVRVKGARDCMNPDCTQRSSSGCSCAECKEGGDSGALMCRTCFKNEASHTAPAVARVNGTTGKRRKKAHGVAQEVKRILFFR